MRFRDNGKAVKSPGAKGGAFRFGIDPADPFTLVAAAILFTTVALLACFIPARRAARTDPMEALRHE
jgi:putative ABC transport system permease protein